MFIGFILFFEGARYAKEDDESITAPSKNKNRIVGMIFPR
jgi:hypothetical protein